MVSQALATLPYMSCAKRATEYSLPHIARAFQTMAEAKDARGTNSLDVPGEIASSIDSLRRVSAGEIRQYTKAYSPIIGEARVDGREDAVRLFTAAMEAEDIRRVILANALSELPSGTRDREPEPQPIEGAVAGGPVDEAHSSSGHYRVRSRACLWQKCRQMPPRSGRGRIRHRPCHCDSEPEIHKSRIKSCPFPPFSGREP